MAVKAAKKLGLSGVREASAQDWKFGCSKVSAAAQTKLAQ